MMVMTADDVKRATAYYRKFLDDYGYEPVQHPLNRLAGNSRSKFNHCRYMVDEIDKFVDDDLGKAFRWLGFIQGTLFSEHQFYLEELRKHNLCV